MWIVKTANSEGRLYSKFIFGNKSDRSIGSKWIQTKVETNADFKLVRSNVVHSNRLRNTEESDVQQSRSSYHFMGLQWSVIICRCVLSAPSYLFNKTDFCNLSLTLFKQGFVTPHILLVFLQGLFLNCKWIKQCIFHICHYDVLTSTIKCNHCIFLYERTDCRVWSTHFLYCKCSWNRLNGVTQFWAPL